MKLTTVRIVVEGGHETEKNANAPISSSSPGLTSPTFYKQLLHLKVTKVQKDSQVVSLLCAFGICAHKRMLMKLTPGVNFTNILRAAFALKDPKSTKRHWWLDCHFALLGSLPVKAFRKHVGEIEPWYLQLRIAPI